MIPFDYITEWRAEAPWTTEAQVEQDLILSRAELEMNLYEKLSDGTFLSDVTPLVAPDVAWSIEDAVGYVRREILPLLPGEPWKGVKKVKEIL